MSKINLLNESCADQYVDAVVNAANKNLWSGGGICGVIFKKAGYTELELECDKYDVPLNDGDAVITPSCKMKNCRYIIHAVSPNFYNTPEAFVELYKAYFNSLKVLMNNDLHSISFPLISSGIFGGNLDNPAFISASQCVKAFNSFSEIYPEYDIDVLLCAFTEKEYIEAQKAFLEHTKTLKK